MATFYGPWVATNDFRAILEATVSNTSSTQCTVKLVLKIQSNYAYATSSGRASVTCGSTTRSDSASYDAGRTTTLMTETFTVARGSSKKSVSVSGKVWQLNYTSEYRRGSTASGSVTIPAIPYDEPAAPSSCSASRSSDTKAKVTWTNGSTSTTRPRSSTKVERQTDSGKWVQVASVSSSVTSYTDNGISANHRYRYRVRAYGSGGYSSYSTSGYIYTTPAAPRSVSAAVTGAGTAVRITVDGSNAPWASAWEVQASLNGGEWAEVGSYTSFPVTAEVGGGTVRLRARAVRGSLASTWTESATITTITPPLAPTVMLTPSGVVPTDSIITVSWVPSHPDGSDQTQAQVEYTIGSGAAQTATVSGAATTYQLPSTAAESPTTVSVRVRTHGADKEWGAWSGPVALTVAEPPSAHFTSPDSDGATVEALPLVVEWEATDETGVASQTLTLYGEDGRALHTAQLGGDARSYPLSAETYRLENQTLYSLSLLVRGGSTLTVTATRDFGTYFVPPAEPAVTVELDGESLAQSVTVEYGEEEGAPPTVTVDVVRRMEDGSTWLVQGGVGDGETVVDPLPPLMVVYYYDVTATAESGAQVTVTVVAQVRTVLAAFNFGQAAGLCELAELDPDWSHDVARSGTLYHFADGGEGGGLPVAYGGQDVDATRSMGFTLLDLDQLRRLQELARQYFTCWYRDPYGGRALCSVNWSFSSGIPYSLLKVSASMTETVFEEAW